MLTLILLFTYVYSLIRRHAYMTDNQNDKDDEQLKKRQNSHTNRESTTKVIDGSNNFVVEDKHNDKKDNSHKSEK